MEHVAHKEHIQHVLNVDEEQDKRETHMAHSH